MNITYTKQGDYLLPNLKLPETKNQHIGLWGRRHAAYLKEHRKITYCNLLTSGKLNQYLAGIDRQAQQQFDRMMSQMKKQEGITEDLKEKDPMEWVGRMNNIRNRVESIVWNEIVGV